MKVLIVFLFASFIVGGTSLGRPARRHPALLSLTAVGIAVMYYNFRVAR